VLVAYNGVDHHRFNPEKARRWRDELREQHGIAEDAFVALFMGGLWMEKGLGVLLDALARMEQPQAQLVVVGRGDEAYFGHLADELGVGERVTFAGFTPHPERYFGMADCFAFLSRAEGLALVQLEAAASGLPLLLLRNYAPDDLVEEGQSGHLVDYDADQVAAALDGLAADPELCAAMGRRSHELSLSFSWDNQADQIERIFLAALASEGKGGGGCA
jgi:glycosyltransferase involved in cell wall biosynthesis